MGAGALMRNTTECQRKLILLGYLPAIDPETKRPNDDGTFGSRSLDAYNHYRASLGKPPAIPPIHLDALNADLFPEEQPLPKPKLTPNPIVQAIGSIAFRFFLQQLTKGLIPMNFLAGYATNIGGVISILIGVAGLAGIHPAGAASLDFNASIQLIVTGWAALGIRRAISNLGK